MAKMMGYHFWEQIYKNSRLQKVSGFHFAHPLSLSHWLSLRNASRPVVNCPMERPIRQGTDVSAKSQWRHEACQQSYEWSWRWIFWGLPITTWVILEADSLLVKTWDEGSLSWHLDYSLWEVLSQRTQPSCAWNCRNYEIFVVLSHLILG